ncbi:MAG TPA: aminotransferase class V-fold PLP-dependent enzyme [Lacipirellulaceae bacterium]|jgi:cysteine desulfurase family protein|nr:aminotransferase class V-fold PLP-dependent enzyme [Lacipirellulaceae bacterium]
MTQTRRIYLDNAATTWPKPESVYDAVDHYQREIGAPNGRSGYREAQESNRIVERARQGVADLIGADDASHIILGLNCSDMLNMAIRGVVRSGDHVVTTVCDHNSVLRPLRMLRETADVTVTYVPCDAQGFVSPDDVKAAIRTDTRLVAVNHASNVTGAIQPIEEIGRLVRATDALFLVDAAQSLGHVPLDVRSSYADLLAAPGHKGLLGPLGTGILFIRPGIESEVQPLRYGGTGTQSDEDRQPDVLPQKFEPGNHNLVGLAGLVAATTFLKDQTIEAIHAHHTSLGRQLLDELSEIDGVTIYGPKLAAERTSVVSITIEGYEPQELAAILDSTYRIQTRAGFQCAPRMHEALGTVPLGGTLRFSPGFATTSDEINRAVGALQEVAAIAIR